MRIDYTFNPWWGCTRVSPGCEHCYAEALDARTGGAHWGKGVPRRTFGEKYWARPLKWDRDAAKAGERAFVFCASMADVFDAEAPPGQLERLWALIRRTPHLDWLLLTKREGRISRSLPPDWGEGFAHVWLGVTAEDAERARQRLPVLLSVPARHRFTLCEPLLGPVDLRPWLHGLDWVYAGQESGPGARRMHPDWLEGLRARCQEAGVAFTAKPSRRPARAPARDSSSEPLSPPVP